MSEMEYNKGKLTEVTWQDIFEVYPDADPDDLMWDTDGGYDRIGGRFFKVEFEKCRAELDEINVLNCIGDGVYEFETYHCNGGAHWTELVEEKLKEI